MSPQLDLGLPDIGRVSEQYIPTGKIAKQLESLREARTFSELVDIAKTWVAAYGSMPEETKMLFKYYHLLASCRRMGVDQVMLDAGTADSASPTALLLGPEVTADRWSGLAEKSLMQKAARARFQVASDGRGALIKGLGTDRSKWLDLLLEVLLPLATFVEEKQNLMQPED